MVASFDTVEAIVRVMVSRLSRQQVIEIVSDLKSVPGNKSFRDTILRLEMLVEREYYLSRVD